MRATILNRTLLLAAILAFLAATGCEIERAPTNLEGTSGERPARSSAGDFGIQERLDQYTRVPLTTDLQLTDNDREVLEVLLQVADIMDEVFWEQAYGDRQTLLESVDDRRLRRYIEINYGPWDRLRGDEPFVDGVGARPLGGAFYPRDATREDLRAAAEADELILDLYTVVRRDSAGALIAVPYHEAYRRQHETAAELLRQAASITDHQGLRDYLELRADALLTDRYGASDRAWLNMRGNRLDFIVGPVETYEDGLFGAKAAHEAVLLVKDLEWSQRLEQYVDLLPGLQSGLPVPARYRAEEPGSESHLGAYDAIYYAGHANAGGKPIAINLPNDQDIQREVGTRRLQLKNAMRAKFQHIMMPIADLLIVPEQRAHVTFDAFFENVMFHEIAHGLGIRTVIDGTGRSVNEALLEHAAALEEGKADILGLYMLRELHGQGEMADGHDLLDNEVTFLASIFRSIRFGSTSAHGVANLIRFNYFREYGAFTRDTDGRYRINRDRLGMAVDSLSSRILRLQGDGDYDAVAAFVDEYGRIDSRLQTDLDRLRLARIPVDVVFDQGADILGLGTNQ